MTTVIERATEAVNAEDRIYSAPEWRPIMRELLSEYRHLQFERDLWEKAYHGAARIACELDLATVPQLAPGPTPVTPSVCQRCRGLWRSWLHRLGWSQR